MNNESLFTGIYKSRKQTQKCHIPCECSVIKGDKYKYVNTKKGFFFLTQIYFKPFRAMKNDKSKYEIIFTIANRR